MSQTTLYVTDYTANELNHEADGHELGPLKMITKLVLFDSQHEYSEELVVGKYYALENVRMRVSGIGMECAMGSRGDTRRRFFQVFETSPDEQLEAMLT